MSAARERKARPEPRQNAGLAGAVGDQVKGVDPAALADAVHAPDALLEPHRVPRQLEVDHQPAGVMQVQAFGGRVGRQQQRVRAPRENSASATARSSRESPP